MDNKEFEKLIESVKEAGDIKRGNKSVSREFIYSPFNVKQIREKLGLSQGKFSKLIHVSVKTLQNWEQGRREPRGPALALLKILKNDPKHAIAALS